MSLSLLENTAKTIVGSVISPVQRYFTYIFILVGILWLGGANYYYYTEECTKFKGTLITGLVFLGLAIITTLWEYFMEKERAEKNYYNELAVKTLPIFLPIVLSVFKNIILSPRLLKSLAIIGIIFSGVYYATFKKNNKFNL